MLLCSRIRTLWHFAVYSIHGSYGLRALPGSWCTAIISLQQAAIKLNIKLPWLLATAVKTCLDLPTYMQALY